MSKDTVRGCITRKWKTAGSPAIVKYEIVFGWAKDCCDELKKKGLNPAPEFIKKMKNKNEKYVKAWLKGCRFPFRIIEDDIIVKDNSQSSETIKYSINSWRACLKCGRLNFVDAVYCSYCGNKMPN